MKIRNVWTSPCNNASSCRPPGYLLTSLYPRVWILLYSRPAISFFVPSAQYALDESVYFELANVNRYDLLENFEHVTEPFVPFIVAFTVRCIRVSR